MFNRTTDPNNLEELMIAEYYRRVDEYKDLQEKYEELQEDSNIAYKNITRELQKANDEIARLQGVIEKDTGIVDLQYPTLMYKASVAGDYYFKDWLEDHASDAGPDTGLVAYIAAINSSDTKCIEWFKKIKRNSYSRLVSVEKHTFTHTLKVSVFGTFAYDPDFNRTHLFEVCDSYSNDTWVNMPLETFNHKLAAEIRETANEALREYQNELAKKEAAEEEA